MFLHPTDDFVSVFEIPQQDNNLLKGYVFLATGRLHRGLFDGFVVVQGIVSNDPKRCSTFVLPGIGFLGNYQNGRPHGVCWRELLGGGWIYGEVNDDGLFTGNTTTYFPKTSCIVKITKCVDE